ncbi:unnamed protein product [Cunninghamella blakesleeana]
MPSLSVSDSVCSTQGCQTLASQVLNDINLQADPCSDFYQYTCGGWLKNASIPDSQSGVGTFNTLLDQNANLLIDIFSKDYQETNFNGGKVDEKLFNMAKNYYQSCMNEDLLEKLGSKPLNTYLEDLKKEKDILNLLIELEKIDGVSTLFDIGIGADDKDPTKNIAFLSQPDLRLPSKEYYEQQPYVDAYRDGLKKLSKYIFPSFTDDIVDKCVDLEVQIAKISDSLEDQQDPRASYNPITIDELQEKYGFIDWKQYFDHFKVPNKLIYNHQTTLRVNASALDKTTNAIIREMNAKISGKNVDPPRNCICIDRINGALGDALGHYFIKKAFVNEKETSEKVKEFLKNIHTIFKDCLQKVNWLDPTTRAKAIEKAEKMDLKSMYGTVSPNIASPESLQGYFGELVDSIHDDSQFNNSVSVSHWGSQKKWDKLNTNVDKNEWDMYPQEVNAYYSPNFNQIVVPAGILQPPFFDINSMAISYGGIGVVIGHEISHGFDNSGRLYDGDGNLVSWWSNATEKSFDEKSQCFIDEYSKFSIEGPDKKTYNVNGKMTLGENLADNGGMSVSFEAFKKEKDHKRLPGVDLTPEQLFFVNFGRIWCSKLRPEKAIERILGDVHSPADARVNGAVQNMPEFATAFKCAKGTPMNPDKKCKVW